MSKTKQDQSDALILHLYSKQNKRKQIKEEPHDKDIILYDPPSQMVVKIIARNVSPGMYKNMKEKHAEQDFKIMLVEHDEYKIGRFLKEGVK